MVSSRLGPVEIRPTGAPTSFNDVGQYRPSLDATQQRIEQSYLASVEYLDGVTAGAVPGDDAAEGR